MNSKGMLFGSVASIALVSAGSAQAQVVAGEQDGTAVSTSTEESATEEPGTSGQEIVITARGREELVIDVPYNFSAVSGEDIEARGIVDAPELLRSIPGVAVVDRGYRNSGVFNGVFIRGINVDGSANGDYWVTGVSSVSTYIDRTPLFANFVLSDIERVEVLRGPQGTLYGSGSLGGTVRYILREPKLGDFHGRVGVTLSKVDESGSWGKGYGATLNLPIGSKLALRLNGTRLDYPGLTDYANIYVRDANGIPVAPNGVGSPNAQYERVNDADYADIWYGRASLLFEPTDNFRVLASYMRQSDEIGGRRQWTRGQDGFGRQYERGENGAVLLEPSERDAELASLEATLDLGFASVTSSTSYYDHSGGSTSDNTGLYAQAAIFSSFYYNYPRPVQEMIRTYSDKSWVQEVRLVSESGGQFDYVLGGYYQDQKIRVTEDAFLRGYKRWYDEFWFPPQFRNPPFTLFDDENYMYRRAENYTDLAFYGELTFHVTDTFQLTGGARWFKNKSFANTFLGIGLYSSFNPDITEAQTVRNSDVLFKGNFSWDVNDKVKIYGTVSEGYRRGGANAVPDLADSAQFGEHPGWQSYGPDTVVNYELGAKGDLGAVRYNVAAFHIDWDDIQLNTSTPNLFYAVQNGPGAKATGVEVELSGDLGPVGFTAGYTYVDARLSADMAEPHNPTVPFARKGAQLPGSPKHSANVALEYSTRLGNDIRWSLRGSGYYQSSTRNAVGFGPLFGRTFEPFSIWNASTTIGKGGADLTLFIKNIFNSRGVTGHYSELFMGTNPGEGFFGNASRELISLPRTIGASVNFNF